MRGRPPRPAWAAAWLPAQLSKRLLLSTALQLLLVGGALEALGYVSGRRSGLELANASRQQHAITHLADQLSARLEAPRTVNRLNRLAIQQGAISLGNFEQLGKHFWLQLQLFPLGYINYGTPQGDFIGVERLNSGEFVLNEDSARPLGRGNLGVYALGPYGSRGSLQEVVPGMTPFHNEAWYADTVKAGKPTWSSVYQWEDKPEVFAISYNEPLYDSKGTLLGVIGSDFVLSQLGQWLKQVWHNEPGLALIVEPNGMVVASSRPNLTTLVSPGAKPKRARLDRVANALAQAASRAYFLPTAGDSLRLHAAAVQERRLDRQPTLDINGATFVLDAHRWGRAEGLNWLLITAMSQDQALAQTQHQGLSAVLLGLLALGVALLLTREGIRWLLAPMELLQQRAQQASQKTGDPQLKPAFDPQLPAGTAAELVAMASAFGLLVERLRQSQIQLAAAAQRERLKDAQALELLQEKLRSSLRAAAVAHEINQPLSNVLLNSRLLLQSQWSTAPLPPELARLVAGIAQETSQVVITIEKMRSLLRNVQTSPQPLNLAHVAQSALLYMRPNLSKARVQVETDGLERPVPLAGDAAQIQIAIVNLLRNSLEALQHTDGPRLIKLKLSTTPSTAMLAVLDNGPGFCGDFNPLEPLTTGKSGGSGLGLFVVQTTLENHGGSVNLTGSALGGAGVELSFPLPRVG